MEQELKTCPCGRTFSEEQSTGNFCFRCKLDGISFNWVGGGGYGRKAFHEKTYGDVHRETLAGAKAKGTNLVKRSTRQELI